MKYSFGSFPQHLETEAVLQTVKSTGLGFAVDSDCLASALGWGPFVLGAMNIMKESDLALNLQHTHTSMLNWGSTVYPYYGTYTLISSILSPLTLFVNATETDWVVFPVFRYHIISGLNVLKIDPLKSVFWAKWHHGHTGDFILISENFIWNLLVNNTMTEKKKKKKNKQNPDAITGLTRTAWLDCLPQQELSGGSLSV